MSAADYWILFFYLILLAAVTWRFRKTTSAPEDFFLAGRKTSAFPIGLSVMVTAFSAVNYLALPGEVCAYGLYVLASLPAFFLAAWPVVKYWMPFFNRTHPVSVYAFLEERFDLKVRIFASTLFLLWRIFWMAVALYASCKIMNCLTGIGFIPLLLISGLAAAIYSSIGGMKAVIWTDVLQFFVLFGSIALSTFFACRGTDFREILVSSGQLKPFRPLDPGFLSLNPQYRITLWSALLGSFVTFLTRFGADQMVMQRYLSARSLASARRGLWISGFASTISLGILALFGLALHVHMKRSGLPAGVPPVRCMASLLRTLPAGIPGLVGAGLLAATMSSIDSGLNSCSAAIATDFQKRLGLRGLPPKILTLVLALAVMAGSAFILPELNRNNTLFVILNKTVNVIGTPILAVMLCALFIRKSKADSVFYGAVAGTALTILFSVSVRHIALHYYAVLSLISTLAAILLFSVLFRKRA